MTDEKKPEPAKTVWTADRTHPEKAAALRTAWAEVMDPEIALSIVQLGLIREVTILEDHAQINMVLTTPYCPYGPALMENARQKAAQSQDGDRSPTQPYEQTTAPQQSRTYRRTRRFPAIDHLLQQRADLFGNYRPRGPDGPAVNRCRQRNRVRASQVIFRIAELLINEERRIYRRELKYVENKRLAEQLKIFSGVPADTLAEYFRGKPRVVNQAPMEQSVSEILPIGHIIEPPVEILR